MKAAAVPGLVVRLKSDAAGRVLMTVRCYVGLKAARHTDLPIGVHCDWHDINGRPHSGVYYPDQLLAPTPVSIAGEDQFWEPLVIEDWAE